MVSIVKNAWDKISADSIINSFEACGISESRRKERFSSRLEKKLEGSKYVDRRPVRSDEY